MKDWKIAGWLLALCITLCLTASVTVPVLADGPVVGMDIYGSGTEEDPYVINTTNGFLLFVNNFAGGYFAENCVVRLNVDVDLSGICGEGRGSWTPIGTAERIFKGVFDGEGRQISGLYIDGSESGCGLFGFFSGTVRNLNVSGSVAGSSYVGGIAGLNDGIIENCTYSGTVNGQEKYIGGITGISFGTISGCRNTAAVTGGEHAGGITGYYSTGSIIDCVNDGNITGSYTVGGICGINESGTLKNCVNNASVSSEGNEIGGITGSAYSPVYNCVNYGNVAGKDITGGITGINQPSGKLFNCINYGTVTGTDDVGGVAGQLNGYVSECIHRGEVHGSNSTGGIAGAINIRVTVENCSNEGTVYSIQNSGGIAGYMINGSAVKACHNSGTVSGENAVGGIAGKCDKGTVVNCTNNNSGTVSGEEIVGGIAGHIDKGTVVNCTNNGVVTAISNHAGGIAGAIRSGSTVKTCHNSSTVSGDQCVGGITGTCRGTIVNCTNSGVVAGIYHIGGIAGQIKEKGTVLRCTNTGGVGCSGNNVGGIVGTIERVNSGGYDDLRTVSFCSNYGIVRCGCRVGGGIVGLADATYGNIYIENCYNAGTVQGLTKDNGKWVNYRAGGIVGCAYEGHEYHEGELNVIFVKNCLNTGTVEADYEAGGIVGQLFLTRIENCVNAGHIEAGTKAGSLVGWHMNRYVITEGPWPVYEYFYVDIENSYYIAYDDAPQAIGNQEDSVYGGLVFAVPQNLCLDQAQYGGLDFENTWFMRAHGGPRLLYMSSDLVDGVISISNVDDLIRFRDNVNAGEAYMKVTVRLEADIDLTGTGNWTPIAYGLSEEGYNVFQGTFDGNNHVISGLNVEVTGDGTQHSLKDDGAGLFGRLDGTVKNLRVSGNVKGSSAAGGIAGYAENALLENCSFVGNVEGQLQTGGVIGVERQELQVGGLVGALSYSTLRGCTFSGNVSSPKDIMNSTSYTGGLAGTMEAVYLYRSLIEECSAEDAYVYGSRQIGGLVGYQNGGLIKNCIHTGTISGQENVGGITGKYEAFYVDGDDPADGMINCAHVLGDVYASEGNAGGIIGYADITNTSFYGLPETGVKDCYYLSGFVNNMGQREDIGINGLTEGISGHSVPNPAGMATPVTIDQLKDASSFTNWDFENIWVMPGNRPYLQRTNKILTLHANNGTGAVSYSRIPAIGGTLPLCLFIREGYEFLGWNTQSDAGGTYYENNTWLNGLESVELYAVWIKRDNVAYVNKEGALQPAQEAYGLHQDLVRLRSGWYYAEGNITYENRIQIDGDVNIILKDGCQLTVMPGIHVPEGSTLTVWGQNTKMSGNDFGLDHVEGVETNGTGLLRCSARSNAYSKNAGIGGDYGEVSGMIRFYGGHILSDGATGAGIGGAEDQDGGIIEIYGACVEAYGFNGAAAIGGGYNGSGGSIAIIDSCIKVKSYSGFQNNNEYTASAIGAGGAKIIKIETYPVNEEGEEEGDPVITYEPNELSPATLCIVNSRINAAADAGKNGCGARAIGTSLVNDFDERSIYRLEGVTVLNVAGNHLLYEEIRNACTASSVDLLVCWDHEGSDSDPEICGYCGRRMILPVITKQPADITLAVGSTAKFTVEADGEDLAYQWQYRNSATDTWKNSTMACAKTDTFSFKAETKHSGHQYRCRISNTKGTVYTDAVTVIVTLKITAQPKDVTVAIDETVKLTVTASGSNLTYQWQYRNSSSDSWKNSTMACAKTNTFTFTAAESHSGHQYRCIVSDENSSVNSKTVTVTVTPKITTQPKDVLLAIDSTVKLTVAAKGTNLTYQWQYRNSATDTWKNSTMACAKTDTFSFKAAESHSGHQYRCLISNGKGTAYSSEATVTVRPLITTQPKNTKVSEGATVKLTVAAKGTNLTYQWQYRNSSADTWKNSTMACAKTDTFSFKAAASHSGHEYRCAVSNGKGTTYTNAAVVTVTSAGPKITTQPKDVTVAIDGTVKLTVAASGSNLTYQWQYRNSSSDSWKNSTMACAKTNTFSFKAAESHSGHQYRCLISNGKGTAYSSAATVTVRPLITTQPKDTTVSKGATVKLTVAAKGTNLTYQWQYRNSATDTWKNSTMTCAKTNTFTFTAAASHSGHQYRCAVSNGKGTTYTNTATVTVK